MLFHFKTRSKKARSKKPLAANDLAKYRSAQKKLVEGITSENRQDAVLQGGPVGKEWPV